MSAAEPAAVDATKMTAAAEMIARIFVLLLFPSTLKKLARLQYGSLSGTPMTEKAQSPGFRNLPLPASGTVWFPSDPDPKMDPAPQTHGMAFRISNFAQFLRAKISHRQLRRPARKRNLAARPRQNGTTGKSVKTLSSPSAKNIPLNVSAKSVV
jgi:hypothetical protein